MNEQGGGAGLSRNERKSEQLMVRSAKQNKSREMHSPVRRNTRNNETQALSTGNLGQV